MSEAAVAKRDRGVGAPQRVLVRLPNWLGDALMARPLLHALRHALCPAEIRAVGPEPLVDLLASEGMFDAADAYPAGRAGRSTLADGLRAWRPDVALVLPPSFSSAWWAWRTGARDRIGFSGEWRSGLLTRTLPRPARGEPHVAEGFLSLGRLLGAEPVGTPSLRIVEVDRERADALLTSLEVPDRFAILAPGAIYGPAKRWPAERFAALGRAFESKGWTSLICGAAADRPLAVSVAGAIGASARPLAGRTSLGVQAALCARAAVVVSNDSGLAHLASAVGAPTVAVFGSTSSAWTAPLGERVRVVQRAPVCAPCFQRTCRIGYRCLAAVTVEDVARACAAAAA